MTEPTPEVLIERAHNRLGPPGRGLSDDEALVRDLLAALLASEQARKEAEGERDRLWTERRQILEDAGADEFDLLKKLSAAQVQLERMREALEKIDAVAITRNEFVGQGPAILLMKFETVIAIARQALTIPETLGEEGVPGVAQVAHVAEATATEAWRGDETTLTQEEFCARFKAEMLRIAGPTFGNGDSIADYADQTAPTYWDEEWQRIEGPEVCAREDVSCWED